MQKKRKRLGRKLLSFLLTLAMVVGLVPGMGLTAYAQDTPTAYISPENSGTVNVVEATQYNENDSWQFTATPAEGYSFNCWSYSDDGSPSTEGANPIKIHKGTFINYGSFTAVFVKTHDHEFTYNVEGATITATCTADGCDLPVVDTKHVATLTIAANGGTYDGTTAYGATITDANSLQGDAKVQYQKKTDGSYGTATETAPKDAGDYKASITVGGETASVEYTISKANPTAVTPSASATYGQTLADVALVNPAGNTDGTWAWVDAGTTSVGSVDSHTFKANFTPTDTSNYNTKSNVDVTVTVGKADNPATITSTATVTKGGNTVDLTGNVTKNGATGDVSYAISGEANGCTLDGSVLTSGDTTGTVMVNVTVAADGNYNALAATPITVTINKANAVAATVTANNRTYDGTEKPLVNVTGTATGGTMQYALGTKDAATQPYTTSIPKATNVGTYYVWYKAKGDANHNDSTATCIVVVIGEKVSVSYTVTFKVVNGAWNDGTTEDKNVVLSGYEGDTLKLTENQIPAVGSKPNDNYKAGSWDIVPTTSMAITTDKTFTYTYTQDKSGTQGTTNEEVIQEDNTPKANVSGLDNNLTNNIMTPQEKAMVNSGQNSILKLVMKKIDASVPQQDKKLTEEEIKKVSNNANVAMFLDLSLWLTIGHNYSRQIESTGDHKIGVELEVPEDKRAPAGVIRTFLVVQIHNNASNIIARTTAIHIPLVISDFSTYALAYVDEPAEKVGFYSGLKITQKNDKIKISWDKTEGVAKYEAYVTYCGKKYPKKPTKSTTSNSVTIKKIKDKKIDFTKNFKLYVAAYDGNGNIIGKSVNAHFAGKDSKEYKNPKDIKLKTKSITIAKGQTSKIKASVKMEKGKGKELSDNHAPKFRYKTTNTNVATVDKKGKVTGVNSGTCIIYVYAKNGRAKKVAVTVN